LEHTDRWHGFSNAAQPGGGLFSTDQRDNFRIILIYIKAVKLAKTIILDCSRDRRRTP
jgi:hypothetical protein